jgi:hypothetical protein
MVARPDEARGDFERALAIDPENLVALNGLAALALTRGEPADARAMAMKVTARQPDFHAALLTLAGADIAEGKAGVAEARLKVLLGDKRLAPPDRAIAHGRLGDALHAEGRYHEAFAAYEEANRQRKADHAAEFEGRQGTLDFVHALTASIAGKRIPTTWGRAESGPARRHVFWLAFPGSGATSLDQMLEDHDDIAMLAGKECLIDAARAWMADMDRFEQFCGADDAELDACREAYWKRVAEEGAEPAGKVFVDANPFNMFKLPLIARLFPEARIVLARRDPRDTVLNCFRHPLHMTDPVYQMLTLEGAAQLYAATMELVEATEKAFGLFTHPARHEALLADPGREVRAICDLLGLERTPELRDFAGRIERAQDGGVWRDYASEMSPVLPILQPWIEHHGYSTDSSL